MMWWIKQPAAITFCVLLPAIALFVLAAPWYGGTRKAAWLFALTLAPALFIPSCIVVNRIVDRSRFGGFAYAHARDVTLESVADWLPPNATDITVHATFTGHRARFRIAKPALEAWLEGVRAEVKARAVADEGDFEFGRTIDEEYFDMRFGELGWQFLPNLVEHDGPSARNGAGFTIWYSEKESLAYLRAGYW